MITTRNIQKSYGILQVLKGIDLEIKEGEVVSIVGASGAGKTTLLNIIGTLLHPDEGTLTIGGVNPFLLKEKELARFRNQNIGFVFQFHHLLPEFSAIENVCIPALIANLPKKTAEEKAKELLCFLGLGHRLEHKPSQLSGGEQQRVAIARALVNQPKIVLADEPSGNLDSKNKKELHELFFRLRDVYHQTILIVTHDMDLAAMADRTLVMSDGLILNQ